MGRGEWFPSQPHLIPLPALIWPSSCPSPRSHLALSRGSIIFLRWKLLNRSRRILPSGCNRGQGVSGGSQAAPGPADPTLSPC